MPTETKTAEAVASKLHHPAFKQHVKGALEYNSKLINDYANQQTAPLLAEIDKLNNMLIGADSWETSTILNEAKLNQALAEINHLKNQSDFLQNELDVANKHRHELKADIERLKNSRIECPYCTCRFEISKALQP